ncbi:unnamed protein product [Ilex paraguariensis]|uniref:non-specific serine/threonine protein kinase n=1 Tax=Ilex paraguariensis TaxID=185542 RepID=A0ABC8TVV8_9AQUA
MSIVSVVGNRRLCGGISELHLPTCTIKKSKKKKRPLAKILLIVVSSALVGVTFVSSLMFCWLKKKKNVPSTGSLLGEQLLRLSYEMLLKATNGFSLENLIGIGSFGSVYKGILDQEGMIVAVKVLNLRRRGASKSFKAEWEAVRNILHKNLVKIITACTSVDFQGNDFKALVYEFMPNGNLESWLHSSLEATNRQDQFRGLNLLQRVNIWIDVACALDYLHNCCEDSIFHCDLTPSNILLDCDMIAHVGDFGLARLRPLLPNTTESSSIGIRVTIGYTAPDYGVGVEISAKGDVYSYGILLLEMITGKIPTDDMFQEGLNLHKFAMMALPDHVTRIADPVLLDIIEEEGITASTNNLQSPIEATKIEECLTSIVKIGVACSVESPQDRMDMSNVVQELGSIKDKLLRSNT